MSKNKNKSAVKKIFKWFAISGGVLVLLFAGTIYSIFGGMQAPRSGPSLGPGIEQVADSIATIFVLDIGGGKVALIDAGNDPSGKPTLDALKAKGKTADDVAAIFVTHSHPDHGAAVNVFQQAKIYALKDEVEVAAGREPYGSPLAKVIGHNNPTPFKVTNALSDGETVNVGTLKITAFAVPGHTPGSAIYLARGVLFTGDAFGFTSDQKVKSPVYLFSRSVPQAVASLKNFLTRLGQQESEVAFISTSHSGSMEGKLGLKRLKEFVADFHE